jgi:uncharacterized membrane protein
MSNIKTFQIRFNTNSTDETNRWRLIENGKEILVSNIIVDGYTSTTKDWIEEINDYKWHISCKGHCTIKDNIAYIQTVKEESVLTRHILKTISYRLLGTLITVTTAYLLGASVQMSSLIGIGELLIKPIVYFLHERIWYKFIRINSNKLTK